MSTNVMVALPNIDSALCSTTTENAATNHWHALPLGTTKKEDMLTYCDAMDSKHFVVFSATHVYTDYRAWYLPRKQYLQRVSCRFCPAWMFYSPSRDVDFLNSFPHRKILKICKIPTLHYSRIRGDMIETYKSVENVGHVLHLRCIKQVSM